MAVAPAYVGTPKTYLAQVTTANTNRDGTGTIATIATPPAAGCRIDKVVVEAVGVTTAGMVRLYIHDGTTARLYDEVPVLAVASPGATTPTFGTVLSSEGTLVTGKWPLFLQSSFSLRASTHNAETFNIFAIGGDF